MLNKSNRIHFMFLYFPLMDLAIFFIKLQSISLKCLFTCFKSIKGFNTEHIDGLYIYRYAAWNGLTILDPSIYRNKI